MTFDVSKDNERENVRGGGGDILHIGIVTPAACHLWSPRLVGDTWTSKVQVCRDQILCADCVKFIKVDILFYTQVEKQWIRQKLQITV